MSFRNSDSTGYKTGRLLCRDSRRRDLRVEVHS